MDWHSTDAEPSVFTTVLAKMFLKPCVFAVVLARVGLAGARWIVAGAAYFLEKASKKGFWKHEQEQTHKNTGILDCRLAETSYFTSFSCR